MKHKEFTLIELLVVLAMISILTSVVIIIYSGNVSSAKHTVCRNNHKTIVKTTTEKKTFYDLYVTKTLFKAYRSLKKKAEFYLNCSTNLFTLGQAVAWHLSNSLKNPYTPNNHSAYDWIGNTNTSTILGHAYYHDYVRNLFRIRTLCNKKVLKNIITK